MSKFFVKIVYLLSALIVLAFLLDKCYTYTHYNTAPRNTVDWTIGLSEKDNIDYAVIGSSRALHHIDPVQIEKKTGKKGVNLSIPGASVFEINLAAQQLIKNKVTDKIFIQIDYIWNETNPDGAATVHWYPYIIEDEIWTEFEEVDSTSEYCLLRHLPFYRYCKFDAKLGFRERLFSLMKKPTSIITSKGFEPLDGILKDSITPFTYTLNNSFNPHIKALLTQAKKENIEIYFFTAPIYKFQGNNRILAEKLQNYYDFTNLIQDYRMYRDNTHLNHKGAELFTDAFIEKYFQ